MVKVVRALPAVNPSSGSHVGSSHLVMSPYVDTVVLQVDVAGAIVGGTLTGFIIIVALIMWAIYHKSRQQQSQGHAVLTWPSSTRGEGEADAVPPRAIELTSA
jgi:hypothetical protein